MYAYVMAIDPGVTTGLAWSAFDIDFDRMQDVGHELVRFPKTYDTTVAGHALIQGAAQVREVFAEHMPDHVDHLFLAAETFRLRPGARSSKPEAMSAVWVHAVIVQEMLTIYPQLQLMRFTPGATKGTVTDVRLKALGLWFKGKEARHCRDAARVLELSRRRLRHG